MAYGGVGAMTIAEKVHWASVARRRLRIRGAGNWVAAGRPVNSDEPLSLVDDRGIVEYVPGDLTLTARAGTPLSEIAAATHAHGQWLPLEPWGGDAGTLGATISTATAGPYALAMGTPRDAVLGMEFVTGNGDVVRSGGRVVKNVAGFDLTRLLVGSWGTLGIITEATVRLRALPASSRTMVIPTAATRTGLNDLAVKLRALPFTPMASEFVSAQLARRLGLNEEPMLLIRLGGNAKSVGAQIGQLRTLGAVAETDQELWVHLREVGNGAVASWRWSQLPSQFGDTWTLADTSARVLETFFVHGNPARGVVRVVTHVAEAVPSTIVRSATAFKGTVALEQLPAEAWPMVSPTATNDALARAIRDKFDPARILNAGIMGAES